MNKQIEGNGFLDWQGEMIPRSNEEKSGKCRPGESTTVSVLIFLFIGQFGFLSKLAFGKDGGWYEQIVFIILCYVTTIPKPRDSKIAIFTCSQYYGSGIHTGIR